MEKITKVKEIINLIKKVKIDGQYQEVSYSGYNIVTNEQTINFWVDLGSKCGGIGYSISTNPHDLVGSILYSLSLKEGSHNNLELILETDKGTIKFGSIVGCPNHKYHVKVNAKQFQKCFD